MEKTSLKYIEIQNNSLNEAHNIWKSVKNNSKDVKAGEIKARISTQTYIFEAKRAYSTVYENIETLARNMCYEMHLLRTKRIKNLITSTV